MGLRRHLPDEQLDLYLRERMPGRAHRPRTRARAGLLQLRGAPDRQEGRPAGREGGRHAHPRGVAEPPAPKKGVVHTNKHGETVARLVGDACIFLNGPVFPAGAGCAFHIAALRARHQPLDPQARGLLAAPATTGGPGRRRRGARHLRHPPVGPAPLGQGRPGVPLVVHRGTRRLRRVEARLRGDAGGAHQDGGCEGLRTVRGAREGTRAPECRRRDAPPSRGAESWGGSRCRLWSGSGDHGTRVGSAAASRLTDSPATSASRLAAPLVLRGAGALTHRAPANP